MQSDVFNIMYKSSHIENEVSNVGIEVLATEIDIDTDIDFIELESNNVTIYPESDYDDPFLDNSEFSVSIPVCEAIISDLKTTLPTETTPGSNVPG